MRKLVPYSPLSPDNWPESAKRLLAMRVKAPGRLSRSSVAARWREGTFRLHVSGVGFFLGWLGHTGRLDHEADLTAFVAEAIITDYVGDMRGYGLSPKTIATRIDSVRAALAALAPQAPTDWLMMGINRLREEPSDRRRTRERMQPTDRLVELGMSLIRRALDDQENLPNLRRAILFRDGLLLVFTALTVPRLHPLQIMTIGHNLIPVGQTYAICWTADEMKEGRPYDGRIGLELSAIFTLYLTDFRPILLSQRKPSQEPSQAVWLSSHDGVQLAAASIYDIFIDRTKSAFGLSAFPHSFRHSACTTLALERPDLIEIITPLLQHRSTSCRSVYDMAESIEAGGEYGATLDDARFNTPAARRLLRGLVASQR